MVKRPQSNLPPEELAVLSVMAHYHLEPGQMLLLGPLSVKILQGQAGGFRGKLPDKHVLEREEWAS